MMDIPGHGGNRFTDYETMPLALRVAEVAEILAVGRNTAYALVRDGTLSSIRVGRQIRVSRDAVVNYLTSGV